MSNYKTLIENLNSQNATRRMDTLKVLMDMIDSGKLPRPKTGDDVNNHIHTTYSFSPYSPTMAIWMAYNSGLVTAGIMDHDTISGSREFIESGRIVGLATTIGIECRVNMSQTNLNGKRINCPDQSSIAYMALHGIPHNMIDTVMNYFDPFIQKRNIRNRKMIEKINDLLRPYSIQIDFEKDVVPLSQYRDGGSITERHISLALSRKFISMFGRGQELLAFLKNELKLVINAKTESYLLDILNPFFEYDLLGLIKSELISLFYINATDECPNVKDVLEFSRKIGSISAYAYLGDVVDSVTGDKKTQKFEDDYIEELFETITSLVFNAVTYMPSRNTPTQIERLKQLCEKNNLFQISGEDINSPRQSFVCQAMRNESFNNLKDSAWALVGHEKAATDYISRGMFSEETVLKIPDLSERIRYFMKIGKEK